MTDLDEGFDTLGPDKGPPIVCLMCKNERKGDERLYMFGGNRPFMAKFESKFVAFIGKEKLAALQDKYKTRRDRSYICKHCYGVVDKTFDSIQKIQRGVARSVRKVVRRDHVTDDGTDSDQEEDEDLPSGKEAKKKLPPVAERIAEKVASLTLVRINSRVPVIILDRGAVESHMEDSEIEDDETTSEMSGDVSGSRFDEHAQVGVGSQQSVQVTGALAEQTDDGNGGQNFNPVFQPSINQSVIPTSHLTPVTVQSLSPSDISLNGTSDQHHFNSQFPNMTGSRNTELQPAGVSDGQVATDHIAGQMTIEPTAGQNVTVPQPTVECQSQLTNNRDTDEDSVSVNKPASAHLAEILANPLLMVKSPQPIKLPDVKNASVYLCGENGCDWIFTSKFFWENHIRHYHYYGKPHKCPFAGCNKYFPTKSKQRQHVRKHTGERPFVCEQCGKTFRGAQELRHHRGTHTVDKPYQCPKPGCYKYFKYMNSLKRHLQFHDGNYPFPCQQPKCSKAFKNKYELKCHMRLHTGEKPYKCHEPGCGKAFRLPCEFTKHRRAHTGERPFRCQWEGCSAAYITCGGLASHVLSHSSDQHFCCEFCGKTFKHKMSYYNHLKQHTDPVAERNGQVVSGGQASISMEQMQNHVGNFCGQSEISQLQKARPESTNHITVCPVPECGKEFEDIKSLEEHLVCIHNLQDSRTEPTEQKKRFVCQEDNCGRQFPSEGGLRYHRLMVHITGRAQGGASTHSTVEEESSCPYDGCDKHFGDVSSLRDHVTKYHVSIPREKLCPLCGRAFSHIQQLELHVHGFHQEDSLLSENTGREFICQSENCGLRFDTAELLKDHVSWHLAHPPYRCEFASCQRTFLLEKVFTHHLQQHNHVKPYTCQVQTCQQGFATQLKLLKHSKIHFGCFQCPVEGCGKQLQAINSARIHLFRHTGEKPYICTLCGKRFATCAQRIRHDRTHTGEKPYQCEVCNSKFADSGMLKVHLRSHTGERPYSCDQCGQQFVSQSALKSHSRLHTGELPYVCPESGCGKAFRESSSLSSHHSVHHPAKHLCSRCGKIYKFGISKHKCKLEIAHSSPQPIQPAPPPPPPAPHLQPQALHLPPLQPPPPPPPLPVPTAPGTEFVQHQMQPTQLKPPPPPLPSPAVPALLQPSSHQQQLPQTVHHLLLPPPPLQVSPQYNSGNMTEPVSVTSAAYLTQVNGAAPIDRTEPTEREDYGTVNGHEIALMPEADRNQLISSPYYNYMILYDKPVSQ